MTTLEKAGEEPEPTPVPVIEEEDEEPRIAALHVCGEDGTA